MNRGRSLLNFSSPARALKKFTSPVGTVPQFSIPPVAPDRKRERYNPPGSSVILYCTDRSSTEAYVLRYVDGPKVHKIAFGPREAYRMTNSCDGLVGVYGRDSFWIANPSIPRVAALPRCSPHVCTFSLSHRPNILRYEMPHTAIGLADPSTGEHKVVRMFIREPAKRYPISIGCEVLSLKKESPHFWRQIEDPPTYAIAMFSMPLVVDGIVYWTVETARGIKYNHPKIRSKFRRSVVGLCFNLQKEKFSLLHHPKGWARKEEIVSDLFLLEGRPCLMQGSMYKERTLWSLEDHVSSEWIRRQSFCGKDREDRDRYRSLNNICKNNPLVFIADRRHKYTSDLKDYRAPYTESNFWPF